ncbi:hypothetical protein [Dactylosporangium salmoneum]|uniref:Uncharacterized protein n=1 Tax=Dactylosporangium salmoneum TaxID=53361 RepID=A0ABN3GZ08_9ACTN
MPGPFDGPARPRSRPLPDVLAGAVSEMPGRVVSYGNTPNKAAALGENIILLANLAVSAWLLIAFLRRCRPFAALERWQTGYLPAYAAWTWAVVLVLPPLYHYH